MSLVRFVEHPVGILEVCLGNWEKSGLPPGFSHTIGVVASCIEYAYLNNLYPIVNDDNWCYGGLWTDFFTPFWDQTAKEHFLSLDLPRTVVDTNLLESYRFGIDILQLPQIHPKYPSLVYEIFQLNGDTMLSIHEKAKNFQDIDIAFQLRLGYENPGGYDLARYEAGIKQAIEQYQLPHDKFFVFTDTYEGVRHFKQVFGDDRVCSLCPEAYDGVAKNIRNKENLLLLLTELHIARSAQYFIGRKNMDVGRMARILRRDHNVVLI